MDRKVREGKLIKKARENIRLQEEADKSWDHRSMYQWLREPEFMRFDDPLRNIPNTKMHIQKGDKALQETLDKMEARMSYQKTERILKKECDNTLGTGAFDVTYEAPPPLEDVAMRKKRRRGLRTKIRQFEEHETRAALSRRHSGSSVERLLVPLNMLLKHSDKKMVTLGIKHSNLHRQLWEYTRQALPRMQMGSDQSGLLVPIGNGLNRVHMESSDGGVGDGESRNM